MRSGFLSLPDYATVIESVPILCVDIDLITTTGPNRDHVLFCRRNNPLMGEWFVIGGRVWKGETALEAVRRKLKEETGLEVNSTLKFTGYYEDTYDHSPLREQPYHTVSLVFEMECDHTQIVLDAQHSRWKLSPEVPGRFKVKH